MIPLAPCTFVLVAYISLSKILKVKGLTGGIGYLVILFSGNFLRKRGIPDVDRGSTVSRLDNQPLICVFVDDSQYTLLEFVMSCIFEDYLCLWIIRPLYKCVVIKFSADPKAQNHDNSRALLLHLNTDQRILEQLVCS